MVYLRNNSIELHIIPSSKRTDELIHTLVRVWEESVRASHHFLNEQDILHLIQFVNLAIRSIDTLIVSYCNNTPVGFMGIEARKIEMLFILPTYFGTGIGGHLVHTAINQHDVIYVDVNEQNQHATGFYRHLGFHTFERTDTDGQGNPFPILRMCLAEASRPDVSI